MFFIELTTLEGRIREEFETYAEAQQRVDSFPSESVIGLAFIFQELPDGSHRLVREDGKPLQFHREIVEDTQDNLQDEDLVPLAEGTGAFADDEGKLRLIERKPEDDWNDLPLV